MPACPNGAQPTAVALGTQQVLDKVSMVASLATLIRSHAPTAWAAFTASLVDVNTLCQLNPDPPAPLDALDFVGAAGYVGIPGLGVEQLLNRYIFEWLRYQAFLQFCVCSTPVLNPTLNCLHATNVVIPAGAGQVADLGAIVIEPAVYDSWPVLGASTWAVLRTAGSLTSGGAVPGPDWDLELQFTTGVWTPVDSDVTIPEGPSTLRQLNFGGGFGVFPRSVGVRLRNTSARQTTLSSLDYCFVPFVASPPPLPTQPDLPGVPVLTPPVCSTDDLCAIVQELARQLTRVSSQVADIQASVGGTDVFSVISSSPISGEGQATLAAGTRAVSVELTHLGPGVFTSALGRPRGLMRAGSIRWGDGTGYSKRQFIDAEDFTRLRPQGSLTVSWQLINECSGTLNFLG